jgi:hypothetical protein
MLTVQQQYKICRSVSNLWGWVRSGVVSLQFCVTVSKHMQISLGLPENIIPVAAGYPDEVITPT